MKSPQILKDILDFVYPPSCLLCEGRFEDFIPVCESCLSSLRQKIQVTSQSQKKEFQHILGDIYFDELIFFWNYSKDLETLIHWAKYSQGKRVGRKLGKMAGEVLADQKILKKDTLLIPVPLHPFRLWKRGYNQSDFLASGISKRCDIPIQKKILKRKRHTKPQSKLNAEERQTNVQEAFQCTSLEIQDKTVYLVDDVATTGATLNNCSRALKLSGVKKVFCVVLARPSL